MKKLLCFVIVCFFMGSFALAHSENKNVVECQIMSQAMNKSLPALVYLPDSYNQSNKRYPVVYLIHGHGGNYKTWSHHFPYLQETASKYDFIIVCPDGGNSWYWDSPINPKLKYETFVSKELISFVDSNFRTKADRKARAIVGNSMGGHGALFLAFRHQDVFSACGAIAGGVDIRPFPYNWNMQDSLGDASKNSEIWEKHTVINLVNLLKPNVLRIKFDIGTSDFFYHVNNRLHKELLYRNIPHDYTERSGAHTWDYAVKSLPYHFLFFSIGFNQ